MKTIKVTGFSDYFGKNKKKANLDLTHADLRVLGRAGVQFLGFPTAHWTELKGSIHRDPRQVRSKQNVQKA